MSKSIADRIKWRLEDIKEMLMSRDLRGNRLYGCDEWSIPIKNIDKVIKMLDEETE